MGESTQNYCCLIPCYGFDLVWRGIILFGLVLVLSDSKSDRQTDHCYPLLSIVVLWYPLLSIVVNCCCPLLSIVMTQKGNTWQTDSTDHWRVNRPTDWLLLCIINHPTSPLPPGFFFFTHFIATLLLNNIFSPSSPSRHHHCLLRQHHQDQKKCGVPVNWVTACIINQHTTSSNLPGAQSTFF